MTATSGKPIREVPAVVLPPAMAALQMWRNADHEDSIRLSRDDVVTLVEEMRQQLADAQAAHALVVERAANRLSDLIFWQGDDEKGTTLVSLREAKAVIRALADPSGVEALAALRADLARKDRAIEAWREDLTNERAERDALAAKLAAAEARVGVLTEAMDAFACDCSGRCERMEWLPADNGICLSRKARTALTTPAEETNG